MRARHEPKVGHQFASRAKASPIGELGREHHGPVGGELAKALKTRDLGGENRRQREGRDLAIQFIASTALVLEQREIFAKHDPILRRER